MTEKPLVSILCVAYNQKDYIAQTIEGFLMQKVDFPIEILIHDDASTDGTAEIIKSYEAKHPELIKGIYQKENQYSKGVKVWHTFLFPIARGKYFAECDGDDYWSNPDKLQKQVSYLEAHPDCGLTYGIVRQYNQKKKAFLTNRGCDYISFEHFLSKKNCIPALTACYRKDLMLQFDRTIQPAQYHWKMGDFPLWLWFIHNSKVKFFPEIFGVYRIQDNSAAHSSDIEKQIAFYKSAHGCAQGFCKLYRHNERPPFEGHRERGRRYSTRSHDRRKAYLEYKLIPNKNWKYKLLTILHSNSVTFLLLRLYHSIKYRQ